jgi:hypothetical protein
MNELGKRENDNRPQILEGSSLGRRRKFFFAAARRAWKTCLNFPSRRGRGASDIAADRAVQTTCGEEETRAELKS